MNAELNDLDRELIAAAEETLQRCYHPERHTVAASARSRTGKIYSGINIEACAYGPCAEPIALGTAFTAGDRNIETIVAIHRVGDEFQVLSPCGNCRQLLYDYLPDVWVIYIDNGRVDKAQVHDLLPGAYSSGFFPDGSEES